LVLLAGCCKFSSSNSGWGFRQLVALAMFEDPDSGFLVDDTCIFETEFTILGEMVPRTDWFVCIHEIEKLMLDWICTKDV